MTNLNDLTMAQLQRIITIRQQIEGLQDQLESIAGGGGPGRPKGKVKGKRRMSAAGRAAIVAGVKKRWAKYKGKAAKPSKPAKKRRKMSAAAKAKISASAKARWVKAKAAGKTTL
jgi:hypothetical protein